MPLMAVDSVADNSLDFSIIDVPPIPSSNAADLDQFPGTYVSGYTKQAQGGSIAGQALCGHLDRRDRIEHRGLQLLSIDSSDVKRGETGPVESLQ
ncbi:hypothetical protein ANO11243_047130 [Dothideomycetidae sp. 11243]|nr:hypothetical protein ANO11243_047130 [fungal sp. No.11243]